VIVSNRLANAVDLAEAQQEAFGVPALYRPGGEGDGVPVTAIDEPEAESVGQGGLIEVRHEIHVTRAEVGSPARGDTISIDSDTWAVQKHSPLDAWWVLVVRRGGA